jgi:hypothetical protein
MAVLAGILRASTEILLTLKITSSFAEIIVHMTLT